MGNKTPLFECHQRAGAKIIDFAGWEMPIHYGSQIEEHHQVRQDAGMFDVSHMTVVDVSGADALAFLRYLLANDVAKLKDVGKALYSCMLNQHGGVVDDLIAYRTSDTDYRLVVNSATASKDLPWMQQQAEVFEVTLKHRDDLAVIAVQGPNARDKVQAALTAEQNARSAELKPFSGVGVSDWFIARTGYTGEDGLEIILPAAEAVDFWQRCVDAGIKPCGLGARDTLRLEAGLNLYGADMDENTTPLESNLGWTIAWEPQDRQFVGREALAKQKVAGVEKVLVGLLMHERGVLRAHQRVFINDAEGEITSGTFSPTLKQAIAFARIPNSDATSALVEMRGNKIAVDIIKPCFVRNGKSVIAKGGK